MTGDFAVDTALVKKYLKDKLPAEFFEAHGSRYTFKNLWTGETGSFENGRFGISEIEGCGNITLKISPYRS